MSKKTENIFKSFGELEKLINQLGDFNKAEENRGLTDIEYNMREQLKNLRFWFESLYSFNGKSTSRAKQNASKENGKKGGRPPKRITELRKYIEEIKNKIIPELEKVKKTTLDFEEEQRLDSEIQARNEELDKFEKELSELLDERNR